MSLWHCRACTTAYAVGLPACPHCRSTSKEEEDAVPKSHVHRGPTHEGDQPAEAPAVEPVTAPVEAAAGPEPEPEPRKRTRKNVTVASAQVAEGTGKANA